MIISLAEKASDKIQHPIIVKTLRNLGIKTDFRNLIKGVYKNPQLTSHLMEKD